MPGSAPARSAAFNGTSEGTVYARIRACAERANPAAAGAAAHPAQVLSKATVVVDAAAEEASAKTRLSPGQQVVFTALSGEWATHPTAPMVSPLVGDPRFPPSKIRGEESPCALMRLMVRIGKAPPVPVTLDTPYTGEGNVMLFAQDSLLSDNVGAVTATLEVRRSTEHPPGR